MVERRTQLSGVILVLILMCNALCNGRPVAQDNQPDATSIPSNASAAGYPSTTNDKDNENPPWAVIILFSYFGFILFVGFLIWLGGKVYVAIFGMPQLVTESDQITWTCGRCADNISLSSDSEDSDHLFSDDELEQIMENFRERRRAFLEGGRILLPLVINRQHFERDFEQLPFYGVDDLEEALGHKSSYKQPPQETATKLFPVQTRQDVIARHWARARLRRQNLMRNAFQCRTPCNRPDLQSMMHFYNLGQLPFAGVGNLTEAINGESDLIRRYYMSLLPFYGVLNWEDVLLQECACSSATRIEMSVDIEAAVSSPKEPLCPGEVTDFVHYENEIKNELTLD